MKIATSLEALLAQLNKNGGMDTNSNRLMSCAHKCNESSMLIWRKYYKVDMQDYLINPETCKHLYMKDSLW